MAAHMRIAFETHEDRNNQDARQELPFDDLMVTFQEFPTSVRQTQAFNLIYNSPNKVHHFADTRLPLPVEEVLGDEQFLHSMNQRERDAIVDFTGLVFILGKLRPLYDTDYPFYFQIADNLVAARALAVFYAAQFLSYDVYLHLMAPFIAEIAGNPEIDPLFPNTQTFWTYTPAFTGLTLILESGSRWISYRNEAYKSAVDFAALKSRDETQTAVRELFRFAAQEAAGPVRQVKLEETDEVRVKRESSD